MTDPKPMTPEAEARVRSEEFPDWKHDVRLIHEVVIKRWAAWSEEDRHFLAVALAGEVGEALNLIKKKWRGDEDDAFLPHLREELADVRIYLELLAQSFGVNLDTTCAEIVERKLLPRWPEARAALAAIRARRDAT